MLFHPYSNCTTTSPPEWQPLPPQLGGTASAGRSRGLLPGCAPPPGAAAAPRQTVGGRGGHASAPAQSPQRHGQPGRHGGSVPCARCSGCTAPRAACEPQRPPDGPAHRPGRTACEAERRLVSGRQAEAGSARSESCWPCPLYTGRTDQMAPGTQTSPGASNLILRLIHAKVRQHLPAHVQHTHARREWPCR